MVKVLCSNKSETAMKKLVSFIVFFFFMISSFAKSIDEQRGLNQFFWTKNQDRRDNIGNQSVVAYYLYTKYNPVVNGERQELLLGDVQGLLNSNFNAKWPVKIYCPGYCLYCDAGDMPNRYFERGDYNFIVMNWQIIAPDVPFVVPNTRIAGQQAGAFIDFLMETTGVPLSAFHVFGHSAGAHVAGSVGWGFATRHNYAKLIPRISGLDPAAYPDWNSIDDRIDATDGAFVDITHTDDFGEGWPATQGHADFYPNSGGAQAGCEAPTDCCCCNHCRAFSLWYESIFTDVGFVSYRCETYESYKAGDCFGNDRQLMGEYLSLNARGKYYLDTNGEYPFAQGEPNPNLR